MHIDDLVRHLDTLLQCQEFSAIDSALNGLQVARQNSDIGRVACAVDTSYESIQRAAEWKADILIVHHGLFWGRCEPLVKSHYTRVRALIENDLALYAVHLPLDRDPNLGNNISMARLLALEKVQPFGDYHGKKIGYWGILPTAQSSEAIAETLFGSATNTLRVLPFGTDSVHSVGIISGGAVYEVRQAVEAHLDCYITGDASHNIYNYALEEKINVIFGGHYQTETWGVRNLASYLHTKCNLETTFLDIPTGL